jgi:WD40 repeat protein
MPFLQFYQDLIYSEDGFVFVQVLVGHSDHVTCVAVSILNKSLVVSGSRDSNLIIWDINTGNDIHVLTGHLGYVTCVKVAGDGNLAVSGKLVMIAFRLQHIIEQNSSPYSFCVIVPSSSSSSAFHVLVQWPVMVISKTMRKQKYTKETNCYIQICDVVGVNIRVPAGIMILISTFLK